MRARYKENGERENGGKEYQSVTRKVEKNGIFIFNRKIKQKRKEVWVVKQGNDLARITRPKKVNTNLILLLYINRPVWKGKRQCLHFCMGRRRQESGFSFDGYCEKRKEKIEGTLKSISLPAALAVKIF